MSTFPPNHDPHRSHPTRPQDIEFDAIGSSGAVLSNDLLACAGCGVVFKASKIIEKAPSAKMIPADLSHVTCPLCLTTQGWENV